MLLDGGTVSRVSRQSEESATAEAEAGAAEDGEEAMKAKDVTPGRSVRLACGCEATKAVADGTQKFWINRACQKHHGAAGQFRTIEPDEDVTSS